MKRLERKLGYSKVWCEAVRSRLYSVRLRVWGQGVSLGERASRDHTTIGAGAMQPEAMVGDQVSTCQPGPSSEARAEEAQKSRDFGVASDTGEATTGPVNQMSQLPAAIPNRAIQRGLSRSSPATRS
jgi:hypothetical protein